MLSLTCSLVNVRASTPPEVALSLISVLQPPPTHTHSLFPLTFSQKHSTSFFLSIFQKHSVLLPGLLSCHPHTVYLHSSVFLFDTLSSPPSRADFSSLFNSFNIFPPALAPSCLQDHLQNSEDLSINKRPPFQSEKGLKVLGHSFYVFTL